MGNHRRGRAKHQRAGCLLCKTHKDERLKKTMGNGNQRRYDPEPVDSDEHNCCVYAVPYHLGICTWEVDTTDTCNAQSYDCG